MSAIVKCINYDLLPDEAQTQIISFVKPLGGTANWDSVGEFMFGDAEGVVFATSVVLQLKTAVKVSLNICGCHQDEFFIHPFNNGKPSITRTPK